MFLSTFFMDGNNIFLKGKSIGLEPPLKKKKKKLNGRELMIWRTKIQAKVQGKVELKDSICFK
jgi:hypothetical protein